MSKPETAAPGTDDDTITVELPRALKLPSGARLSTLVFREPELGDAIEAEEAFDNEKRQTQFMLERMAGLEKGDLTRLTIPNFYVVMDKVGHWLGNGDEVLDPDGETSQS